MLNVLKVRIYPNKEQELALAKNFGCVRFVWNYYLNKTNNYKEARATQVSKLIIIRRLEQLEPSQTSNNMEDRATQASKLIMRRLEQEAN